MEYGRPSNSQLSGLVVPIHTAFLLLLRISLNRVLNMLLSIYNQVSMSWLQLGRKVAENCWRLRDADAPNAVFDLLNIRQDFHNVVDVTLLDFNGAASEVKK
jgi:hypothetical protein